MTHPRSQPLLITLGLAPGLRPRVWVSSSIAVANDLAYLCLEYKVYLGEKKKLVWFISIVKGHHTDYFNKASSISTCFWNSQPQSQRIKGHVLFRFRIPTTLWADVLLGFGDLLAQPRKSRLCGYWERGEWVWEEVRVGFLDSSWQQLRFHAVQSYSPWNS